LFKIWWEIFFYSFLFQPIGYEELLSEGEKKTETELYRSEKKRKYSMNEESISSTIFNDEEIQLLENDYDRCTFFKSFFVKKMMAISLK